MGLPCPHTGPIRTTSTHGVEERRAGDTLGFHGINVGITSGKAHLSFTQCLFTDHRFS